MKPSLRERLRMGSGQSSEEDQAPFLRSAGVSGKEEEEALVSIQVYLGG